jgi:hypothetical protein
MVKKEITDEDVEIVKDVLYFIWDKLRDYYTNQIPTSKEEDLKNPRSCIDCYYFALDELWNYAENYIDKEFLEDIRDKLAYEKEKEKNTYE